MTFTLQSLEHACSVNGHDSAKLTSFVSSQVAKDDRTLKTTVTAGKVEEPQRSQAHIYDRNALNLSYECQCGARAAKSTPTWCEHAVATLVQVVDPFADKVRPDFEYHKVGLELFRTTPIRKGFETSLELPMSASRVLKMTRLPYNPIKATSTRLGLC